MNKTQTKIIISACILCLVFAGIALASGSAEGAEHKSLFWEYFWKIINFIILLVIIPIALKFFGIDIKDFLKKRTALIEKTLAEAREAKELAQKALAETEKNLEDKDKAADAIIQEAKKAGKLEKERLIEEGESIKAKILEQAKINIELELKEAKENIKAEAAEIALELAEKKIKAKLGEKELERLLEESIKKIENKK